MAERVNNFTIYKDNPYHGLIYGALGAKYNPLKGDVDAAVRDIKSGDAFIFHIHWEEHLIRRARTAAEAAALVEHFIARLNYFNRLGGKTVWTIHNSKPHELEHVEQFMRLRSALAELADRICVHNTHSISVLREQAPASLEKFHLLAHPSYHGIYAPDEFDFLQFDAASPKEVLLFGKVRRYKAIDGFLEGYLQSGLAAEGIGVRVCGEPLHTEEYGDALASQFGAAPGVVLDFRRVPDDEVAGLLGAAGCVCLPYERFLTSGALLAAMTFGAPIVAPNLPQMRETLPPSAHEFLFDPRAPGAVYEKLRAIFALDATERRALRIAIEKRARDFHPERISAQLGRLYDSLRLQQAA